MDTECVYERMAVYILVCVCVCVCTWWIKYFTWNWYNSSPSERKRCSVRRMKCSLSDIILLKPSLKYPMAADEQYTVECFRHEYQIDFARSKTFFFLSPSFFSQPFWREKTFLFIAAKSKPSVSIQFSVNCSWNSIFIRICFVWKPKALGDIVSAISVWMTATFRLFGMFYSFCPFISLFQNGDESKSLVNNEIEGKKKSKWKKKMNSQVNSVNAFNAWCVFNLLACIECS